MEKRINELADKMLEIMKVRITEYSHSFSQSRENCNESDSNLGSPKPAVSLDDDFEPSYPSKSSLNDVMSLLNLEQESDLPLPLSPELAPCTNSQEDITDDVLIYADPTTLFNDSFESAKGQESENASELDTSMTTDVKRHDLDDSEDIAIQEPCEEEIGPTNLEFNDHIFL